MPPIALTAADNGRLIEVGPGDTLTITLPENPTTGFRWEMDRPDPLALEVEDDRYTSNPGSAVGGGGARILVLRALSPAQLDVGLRLRRAWDPPGSAVDLFRVSVRVQPPT